MNKKIRAIQILVLVTSSCYVCQSFAMESDREKVDAIEKHYHLVLDLADPERALPVLHNLAKANGEKTLWHTWAYEDITQAITDLREIQTRCSDNEDAVFTETLPNLLLNLEILKYMVARQDEFETECIAAGVVASERKERVHADDSHERLIADAHTKLTRADKAQERFAAALAVLTGRVDTHDKFATDLASLTSKVATHDNLVGTLALLKSEVDGLSSSVSSRFADSETREKTELARMSGAHDQVAKALAALTGRVDAHDSLTSALAGLANRVDELNKSIPARFSGIESRLGAMDIRMGAHDQTAKTLAEVITNVNRHDQESATVVSSLASRLEEQAKKSLVCDQSLLALDRGVVALEKHHSAFDSHLGAMDTRMGTFASQADLVHFVSNLNAVEDKRRAMESRLAAVEGRSSSAAGLEARLGALEGRIAPVMEIYERSNRRLVTTANGMQFWYARSTKL